jgi:hypothetical protein
LLGALVALKLFASWKREPWWLPEYTDKGGRGAGPGATNTPVPQGRTLLWSEATMKLFATRMLAVPIAPRVVLLAIAAASQFNADTSLGNTAGLLLLNRDDLTDLGYTEPPPFEQLDAPHQIPWIGTVIAYRVADSGRAPPSTVPDLAVLLHPSTPPIEKVIRAEADRRASDAAGTMLYISHDNLLRHVLAKLHEAS